MNTATPSGTPAELAKRLITFRHEHWTHWTEAENNLVVECVQALRAPSEGEKAEPVAAERERCAAIADDEAEIRNKAGQAHPEDSAARDRCWAGARAARNVARGIRNGEIVKQVASPVRDALADLIREQAEDDGLWFDARHACEAYLQQELRRLHAAVESALAAPPAPPAQPLRMLTMLELLQAKDNHGTYETEDESIQRKFMEVNGLSLGEAGKDASP